jgi:hypothetical protein
MVSKFVVLILIGALLLTMGDAIYHSELHVVHIAGEDTKTEESIRWTT